MAASGIDMLILVRRTRIKLDLSGIFAKPLIGSAIMGAACYVSYYCLYYVSSRNSISTILAVLVGVLIYLVSLIFIKGINHGDLKNLPYGSKLAAMLEKFKL
jgi:stage V sporulation protein B